MGIGIIYVYLKFYINLIENTAKKKIYETNITLNTFYQKGHFIHWTESKKVGDSIRNFLLSQNIK